MLLQLSKPRASIRLVLTTLAVLAPLKNATGFVYVTARISDRVVIIDVRFSRKLVGERMRYLAHSCSLTRSRSRTKTGEDKPTEAIVCGLL